jgi:hypothetical protein
MSYTKWQAKITVTELVSLVESLFKLHKKKPGARMERDKELYARWISIVNKQIDKLVYELYGLTEEERRCSLLATNATTSSKR